VQSQTQQSVRIGLPSCVVTSHPHVALVLQILQALLTPVIAGIAVYIAWQQWKVNERKLALDQYERRLRIYERVVTFLRLVLRDFKPEINDLQAFSIDTAESDFLFESEISQYISEIYHGAWRLWSATSEYRDFTQRPSPDYDHNKVVKEITTQQEWFTKQFGVAKEKFKKYLYISR
jgi:hypothetical protein